MPVDVHLTYRLVADDEELVIGSIEAHQSLGEETVEDPAQGMPELGPEWRQVLPAGSSVLAPGLSTPYA